MALCTDVCVTERVGKHQALVKQLLMYGVQADQVLKCVVVVEDFQVTQEHLAEKKLTLQAATIFAVAWENHVITQIHFVTGAVVQTQQYAGLVLLQTAAYVFKVVDLVQHSVHHHQVCTVALEQTDFVYVTEVQTVV